MLHSSRRRQQDFADREAAGESLWTPEFDSRARTRVMHALNKISDKSSFGSTAQVFVGARGLILEEEGLYFLSDPMAQDVSDFVTNFTSCPHDMFPTVVESLLAGLHILEATDARGGWTTAYASQFASAVNEIFAQERVGWEIIDERMVEIHSKELHDAVIEPAIRLLHDSRFTKADKAYREALEELAQGKPWDAVTDAGTALQEVLTALGCEGDQLGDLIRSAKKKELIAPHDNPVFVAIEKAMHWVAADRSQTGDSHHATDATREDAWLIVHVVGAFIVRLASGEPRKA